MNDSDKIKYFPKNNLKAYDGMSVTAEVWDMAHSEHRDSLRGHLVSMHKPGIITGLKIHANDPADHYVFISPGAAVDDSGRLIIVDQTIAYDFGDEGAGDYLLLLGYAEHEKESTETKLKLIQHEYIIAARQSFPKQPVVELARVTLSSKGASIRDAKDPYRPRKDELDLRYRVEQNDGCSRMLRIAAVCIPSDNETIYQGWKAMAGFAKMMLHTKLVVEMLPALDERIMSSDMLYIAAAGTFSPTEVQTALVKNYYQNGKGILMEGLDESGSRALRSIADQYKVTQTDPDQAEFYQEPFLFRMPPEQIEERHLFSGERLILCTDPLVRLWGGEQDGELMSRSEIRTNLEWGANLVSYCAG